MVKIVIYLFGNLKYIIKYLEKMAFVTKLKCQVFRNACANKTFNLRITSSRPTASIFAVEFLPRIWKQKVTPTPRLHGIIDQKTID